MILGRMANFLQLIKLVFSGDEVVNNHENKKAFSSFKSIYFPEIKYFVGF